MNLRYTDGCTCTSYDVDGTEFIDLDINAQRELAIKLISYTNNHRVFEDIYLVSLEDNPDIYSFSDEELYKFYEHVDKLTDTFEKEWALEDKKKYCIDYITKYEVTEQNAAWLYQHVFESVLECDGKYKYLYLCECCGDSVVEYTLKI